VPRNDAEAVGYNIQITKVTDQAGGHETVTINTKCPPDASADAIYGKIKLMTAAMQKRIDTTRDNEERRQANERAAVQALSERLGQIPQPPGLRTPVDLPTPPPAAPVANGHDPTKE
jgi:hypothetical protein